MLTLELLTEGYNVPVDIASNGSDRLFIVEKRGMIHIYDFESGPIGTPFLDIRGRVNSASSERGLLGLVFHPDYVDNGFFFVHYTRNDGSSVIARYTVDAENADQALPDSEKVLLVVAQPFSNHNAGDLAFGPDGYLYIGMGDGGNGDDPGNRSQNPLELLGKMLRIDVDNGDPYAIPEDNPFADTDFTLDEIWALGLRNPWRFSFDRMTGDLYIADVGQNQWEEINLQPANSTGGENYGWRCYEGDEAYITGGCGDRDDYTFPIFAYGHEGFNCSGSVTGGFRYYGQSGALFGLYIFVDYCTGKFYGLDPIDSTTTVLLQGSGGVYTSFGESSDGELYLASAAGEIFQVKGPGTASSKDIRTGQIAIYPVPASDQIYIDFKSPVPQVNTVINIYNTQGIRVLSTSIRSENTVDIQSLPAGTYVLMANLDDMTYRGRFVVAR